MYVTHLWSVCVCVIKKNNMHFCHFTWQNMSRSEKKKNISCCQMLWNCILKETTRISALSLSSTKFHQGMRVWDDACTAARATLERGSYLFHLKGRRKGNFCIFHLKDRFKDVWWSFSHTHTHTHAAGMFWWAGAVIHQASTVRCNPRLTLDERSHRLTQPPNRFHFCESSAASLSVSVKFLSHH